MIDTFGLKFRTKDPKLNIVLEDIRRTLNLLIDEANVTATGDIYVKVDHDGIADYLNPSYFQRGDVGHIKIKQGTLLTGVNVEMLGGKHASSFYTRTGTVNLLSSIVCHNGEVITHEGEVVICI